MNGDTRHIRKDTANDNGEASKPRSRAPLEKVPGEKAEKVRKPLLGNEEAGILRRFLEEARYVEMLGDGKFHGRFDDMEICGVNPNDVEKLFSTMCAMEQCSNLFDTFAHLCYKASQLIEAMVANAGPQAIPVLINGLSSEDEDVRNNAQKMLAAIGKPAVLPLIAVLTDENSRGRVNAAYALGEIGDIRAVPPLIEVAKCKEEEALQYVSIEAVGEIAEKHPEYDWREAAMVLADLCNDSCSDIVGYTLETIGDVTTDPELKRVLLEKGFAK